MNELQNNHRHGETKINLNFLHDSRDTYEFTHAPAHMHMDECMDAHTGIQVCTNRYVCSSHVHTCTHTPPSPAVLGRMPSVGQTETTYSRCCKVHRAGLSQRVRWRGTTVHGLSPGCAGPRERDRGAAGS